MLKLLINFIFPPHCAGCERRLPIESNARVCRECLEAIERMGEPLCAICGIPVEVPLDTRQSQWCRACAESPPYFSAARAIARYRRGAEEEGVIPSIIRRHKYGRDQALSHALAECIGEKLPLDSGNYDVVVPVPLHRARLRWRGFNQAALFGSAVARRMGRPLNASVLIRKRATPPQTARDRRDRQRNVREAFGVRSPAAIANRRVLLVDDVMTTGATADECARALLGAGARRVDVLTLARVL
jgi:ComF family protein